MVLQYMDETDQAVKNYREAESLQKAAGNLLGVLKTKQNLAGVYKRSGDFKEAKELYLEAYEIAEQQGYKKEKSELAHRISKAYKALGDFQNAYEFMKTYSFLKHELQNEQTTKELVEKEAEYKFQKILAADSIKYEEEKRLKDAKIIAHQETIRRKEVEAKQDNLIKLLLFGGAGVLLILAIILYSGLKRKRKDHDLISEQNQVLEQQKIEIREQHKQLAVHYKEVTDSISYAQRIQNAILPPLDYFSNQLPNSFVFYLPKDIVAGDFYWLENEDRVVYFAAADCTGHGVPGAMVSVVCHNSLNRAVREFGCNTPALILEKTRELVIETFEKSKEEVKDGMDIALCSYNKATKVLEYSGANNGLYLIRDNEVTEVKPDKQPIGKYVNATPFENHNLQLLEGDSIYIFSDGFPDQFGGPKGKKLKYKKFKEILLSMSDLPIQNQKDQLYKQFESWKGELEQLDDVCVIGFKVVR